MNWETETMVYDVHKGGKGSVILHQQHLLRWCRCFFLVLFPELLSALLCAQSDPTSIQTGEDVGGFAASTVMFQSVEQDTSTCSFFLKKYLLAPGSKRKDECQVTRSANTKGFQQALKCKESQGILGSIWVTWTLGLTINPKMISTQIIYQKIGKYKGFKLFSDKNHAIGKSYLLSYFF